MSLGIALGTLDGILVGITFGKSDGVMLGVRARLGVVRGVGLGVSSGVGLCSHSSLPRSVLNKKQEESTPVYNLHPMYLNTDCRLI